MDGVTLEPQVYDIGQPPDLPEPELNRLLGGKAAHLVTMSRDLRLPVPPAFTITTQTCNRYLASGWPSGLDDEIAAHIAALGEQVGRRFGDPADPLLVSVRSGAPISMPGMMDTILNLGLTPATADGLAAVTGDPGFAADCLRRFQTMYREIVGAEAPDDPWQQLRGAVEAVFRSWMSDRARAYREREGIPDDLGTGVTVQVMVFGNRGEDSATGVLFTRNPATGEANLYGDVMFNAQGEDVVAGTHKPESLDTLADRLPQVADELRRYAHLLEEHLGDLCDIEFTIERGRLWLLQVRVGKRSPGAALRMAVEMAEEAGFPCSRGGAVTRCLPYLADPPRVFVRADDGARPLTVGLPASPGVASGEIATSPEAAEAAAIEGRSVILVRTETSPEDVRGMSRAAGVLTARGGLASHAAVVARGWGIPAVVGAAEIEVGDDGVRVAGRFLPLGTRITIDGGSGAVHEGELAGTWELPPEAATLMAWAAELGIEIGRAEDQPQIGAAPAAPAPISANDLLRALLVKGTVGHEQLAEVLAGDPAAVDEGLAELTTGGLVEGTDGGRRLTGEGKLRALDLMAADRAQLGPEHCEALLEAFHALDLRMKGAVTAWQIRTDGAEQALNDHTDARYDAKILQRVAELHEDTVAWMAPLTDAFPRFKRYHDRLERSLAAARDGDQRYVASPRVDSYHSVWFELHEDLIRLAGRRRSDESGG